MKVIAKEYLTEQARMAGASVPIFRSLLKFLSENVDESVVIEREKGIEILDSISKISCALE
ncbi:MAG: hypothetical protein WC827_03235 [Candidatus Paceibacterota bacterium]